MVGRVNRYENAKGQDNDKHCCVPDCTGNERQNPDLSFYRIMAGPELRKKKRILAIMRDPGPFIYERHRDLYITLSFS